MDLSNIITIKSLLARHGFTFSKALGQNFIVDSEICPEMVELAGVDSQTLAVEIGPGIGVLTKELCSVAGKVVAIELDKRLLPVLDETLAEWDNLEVINEDVMKLDLRSLINEKKGDLQKVRICANLPYYITSPIIMMLLETRLPVDSITVMVQKEAAQRLCAKVGSRDGGAITVAVNYYADSEILFQVPRHCFTPSPKVDSMVINLNVRKEPPISLNDEKKFFSMVKAAFAQRRKTAVNSISAGLGIGKEEVANALRKIGVDANIRAEKLSMEQLAEISNEL